MTCPTAFILTKNRCPGQPNEPHPAVKDKQVQNGQAMQIISSEQAHLQSAANEQVEQDVMDDADGEEDEEGALEVVTREERMQLMAEVNSIEEFVRLRRDLGYDDAGPCILLWSAETRN